MSSRPGVARRIGQVCGSAPLVAPLPMMATRGCSAPINSGAIPLNWPMHVDVIHIHRADQIVGTNQLAAVVRLEVREI